MHPSFVYREYEFWWGAVPLERRVINKDWDDFRATMFLRSLSTDAVFVASLRHMLQDREAMVLKSQSTSEYVISQMASFISRSQVLITRPPVAALKLRSYTRLPDASFSSSVGLTRRTQNGGAKRGVPPPNEESSPLPPLADEIACAALLKAAAKNALPFCEL